MAKPRWKSTTINLNRRANDRQVGGDHYNKYGEIQPWDLWWMYRMNPFQANVVKYAMRYRDKDGIKDLEKAKHYIEKLIELELAGKGDLRVTDTGRKREAEGMGVVSGQHARPVLVQPTGRRVRKKRSA